MIPCGLYRAKIYEGNTYLGQTNIVAPLRHGHSGESYDGSGNNALFNEIAIPSVFDSMPTVFHMTCPMTPMPYEQKNIFDVMGLNLYNGLNLTQYIGHTLDFVLSESKQIKIRAAISTATGRNIDINYSYIRGSTHP